MSFLSQLEQFKQSVRITFNDRFMGNEGAKELAKFLSEHRRVELLEIKSNDIDGQGFKEIFESLKRNPNIRQIVIQYNNLGESQYSDWQNHLESLIQCSSKLERLNFSNNKISGQSFRRLIPAIAHSKSLKLIECRYNLLAGKDVEALVAELKKQKNQGLLYVELSGNKIKKDNIDALESILKVNRSKNPISKDKLMMTGGGGLFASQPSNINTFYQNKTNVIDDMSKENVLKHLQDILDQNRRDTAQIKVRMEKELEELLRRQKCDSRQLQQLQNKCNELLIQNRNLKFEHERTVSEHQQMQRDQEHHLRLHQQKLRQANKQLQQLQQKYDDVQERMNKQHEMKMKQIARQWEARLRSVEDKIRVTENDNNLIDNQIKKQLEKRERLRVDFMEEENHIRNKIEEEESQRYGFKLNALQVKLRELEEAREKYIRRNQDILYEIQKTQSNNNSENISLEEEIGELKLKEDQFMIKNKEFLNRNQKLKSEIQLKEITVQKLEQELNQLSEQIDHKKKYNKEQVQRIMIDNLSQRQNKQNEKKIQIEKLNELEAALRNAQLENSKIRQQYAVLAQRLHIGLGKAVQEVFAEHSLH